MGKLFKVKLGTDEKFMVVLYSWFLALYMGYRLTGGTMIGLYCYGSAFLLTACSLIAFITKNDMMYTTELMYVVFETVVVVVLSILESGNAAYILSTITVVLSLMAYIKCYEFPILALLLMTLAEIFSAVYSVVTGTDILSAIYSLGIFFPIGLVIITVRSYLVYCKDIKGEPFKFKNLKKKDKKESVKVDKKDKAEKKGKTDKKNKKKTKRFTIKNIKTMLFYKTNPVKIPWWAEIIIWSTMIVTMTTYGVPLVKEQVSFDEPFFLFYGSVSTMLPYFLSIAMLTCTTLVRDIYSVHTVFQIYTLYLLYINDQDITYDGLGVLLRVLVAVYICVRVAKIRKRQKLEAYKAKAEEKARLEEVKREEMAEKTLAEREKLVKDKEKELEEREKRLKEAEDKQSSLAASQQEEAKEAIESDDTEPPSEEQAPEKPDEEAEDSKSGDSEPEEQEPEKSEEETEPEEAEDSKSEEAEPEEQEPEKSEEETEPEEPDKETSTEEQPKDDKEASNTEDDTTD